MGRMRLAGNRRDLGRVWECVYALARDRQPGEFRLRVGIRVAGPQTDAALGLLADRATEQTADIDRAAANARGRVDAALGLLADRADEQTALEHPAGMGRADAELGLLADSSR